MFVHDVETDDGVFERLPLAVQQTSGDRRTGLERALTFTGPGPSALTHSAGLAQLALVMV